LEAQAWGLPIVASRYCAEVVRPGETGIVLEEVTPGHIREVLLALVRRPAELSAMARAIRPWPFDLDQLGRRLAGLPAAAPVAGPPARAL
jgi:glycosyltransferase involved in cell wall biosynthesis